MNRIQLISTSLAVMALVMVPVQLLAWDAGDEEIEEIEEIEEVQLVEVVQAVSIAPDLPRHEGFTLLSVYGRLHPAFVHMPIGFLLLLVILEMANVIRPSDGGARFRVIGLAATVLSTLPALLSGLLRTSEMWPSTEYPALLANHRLLMFLLSGVLLVTFLLMLVRKNNLEGWLKYTYLFLLFGALVLAFVGGHMGGKLVFGPQHLPF